MEKWLKLMPDFCADPLWHHEGYMVSVESVPISEELRQRLRHWARWHDARLHDEPIKNFEEFCTEGLDLAESLKLELPDWTIIYFDVARVDELWDAEKVEYREHPDGRKYYEYEIGLE
jgi:hypothetical protein